MISERDIRLYGLMYRIRSIEEEIAKRYHEAKMRCPVHLSIGQEAVPAVFSEYARTTDFVVSTHRGHAHYLAKGGNLNAMIAEIYGKSTGCSKGKGGSMHLIDLTVNFMGTSAIVGNSIPIGVGLALSAQIKGTDEISCIFLGDGATEEGVFYESVNFAALRKLPVLFICENNFYSVYSPLAVRQPKGRSIASMVESMGVKVATGTGHDLNSACQIMQHAFEYVRSGRGPSFVEFSTYRWREHCGHNFDNELGYRTQKEFDEWLACDPLNRMEHAFLNISGEIEKKLQSLRSSIGDEIQEAFRLAELASFPDRSEAYKGVYA